MTTDQIIEDMRDNWPDLLLADGFDDAIIGTVIGACRSPVACYDYLKCVEILMKRDGMTRDEAEEHMDFNVVDAFVGELTPLFVIDGRNE